MMMVDGLICQLAPAILPQQVHNQLALSPPKL